jgi:CheY-like chemotaxis protein
LLLRAELTHRQRTLVAPTTHISPTMMSVQTEESAFIGDRVELLLSFPGLLEPVQLEAQVVSQRTSTGPGRPGGWSLGFVFYNDEEQQRLESLLERLDAAVAPGAPTSGQKNHPGPRAGDLYRVLVVDDSTLTRDVFSHGVKKYFRGRHQSVTVDVAAHVEEAWFRLCKEPYDLAIIDYYLPAANGDELINRLRSDERFRGLAVLAISIDGQKAQRATLAAGADLFLSKPIVMDDLFSTLERLNLTRARP